MQRVCGSDYITALKRQAIYKTNQYNAQHFRTVNPVKLNGQQYNDQIMVCVPPPEVCNPTVGCVGGTVRQTRNHALLQDYKFGRQYNYVRCRCPSGTICYLCQPCAF